MDEEKWLYRDKYEDLVTTGVLTPRGGKPHRDKQVFLLARPKWTAARRRGKHYAHYTDRLQLPNTRTRTNPRPKQN